jgi:hypothetical protein
MTLAAYLSLSAANAALFALYLDSKDPFVVANAILYLNVTGWLLLVVYFLFFSTALTTPLVRPLRGPPVRGLLLALSACFLGWVILWPPQALAILRPDDLVEGIVWGTVPILATIASADAWRRAPGGLPRRRARAYFAAFVVNDLSLVKGGALNNFRIDFPALDVLQIVTNLAFLFLLVRALLRDQLFDFDLKLKWTLRRGTLVAILLGAFFVVSALAEQYLQQFGWVVGGLAVGALLFALRPIERAIDRMADRAMPRTTGTPEYLAQRKHEIYRAAIEDAMRDGVVSAKERALLLRLADNLGLSAEESTRIERDVLAVPP